MKSKSISAENIKKHLNPSIKLDVLETVDSTNLYLKRKNPADLENGDTVIALNQTAGRGRFTRKFHSPDGGLYMSCFLTPNADLSEIPLITSAAAVAVCEAIESFGKSSSIKWVNDIIISKKKLCGILSEGVTADGKLMGVIVGIGINLYEPEGGYHDDIKEIAGAVFADKNEADFNLLAAKIINRLFVFSNTLHERLFLDYYRKKSLVLGKEITVISAQGSEKATALAIDDNCRLEVSYKDSSRKLLDSGEISIKL